MEATHGTIAIRSGGSSRTRGVAAATVLAVAVCSSFALGRVTAAESTSIRPAPVVITHPVELSPLRPHQPHHRVKFGA